MANLTEALAKVGWSEALAAKLREEEAILGKPKAERTATGRQPTAPVVPHPTAIASYLTNLFALLDTDPVRGREVRSGWSPESLAPPSLHGDILIVAGAPGRGPPAARAPHGMLSPRKIGNCPSPFVDLTNASVDGEEARSLHTGILPRRASEMAQSSTKQTVLVTGAAGFVGSHLVDRLLGEGFEVIGVDNLLTGDLANLRAAGRDPHFHFQMGDVREDLGVAAQLIFNLACPASPAHYQRDPYATFTTSVVGAMRLIELARARHSTLVQASTSEVYGDPTVHPQPEAYWGNVNPIGPRACYDEGKRGAETLLSDARRCWGVDTRIVRIFNTYGPRMAIQDGRVVSNFIVQALRGEALTVCGDGLQSRSFCYVDDLIEGFVRVARLPALEGPLNLGNPAEFSMLELAQQVTELTGAPGEIRFAPLPTDDPRQRRPDIRRARQLIDFEPRVQLREGLRRTIADFAERLLEARSGNDTARTRINPRLAWQAA
jgi:UDP-glucuronate decarboxylase